MARASLPRRSSTSRPIGGPFSFTISICKSPPCTLRREPHAQGELLVVRCPGGGSHPRLATKAGKPDPRPDQEGSSRVGSEAGDLRELSGAISREEIRQLPRGGVSETLGDRACRRFQDHAPRPGEPGGSPR